MSLANTVRDNIKIAFWGDSLTLGSGVDNYPSFLSLKTGYSLVNYGVAGETSTQIKERFLASEDRGLNTIFWVGRNNYTSPETVKSDIAEMVSALGHKRFFVLSILNGDYSSEYWGQSGYNTLVDLNRDLANVYGPRFIDIRCVLVSRANPLIPQDVTDHARDVPPSSLRSGPIHLNAEGYKVVADTAASRLPFLSGISEPITPEMLAGIFKTPGVFVDAVQGGIKFQRDIVSTSDSVMEWKGNPVVLGRGFYSQRDGNAQFGLFSAGDNRSVVFEGAVAGGTLASKSFTPASSMMRIRLATFGGLTWVNNAAEIQMRVLENHTEEHRGADFMFLTTPIEAVGSLETFNIRSDGAVVFKRGAPILKSKFTPASSSAPGETGTVVWDDNFIYICIATSTWRRTPISTW